MRSLVIFPFMSDYLDLVSLTDFIYGGINVSQKRWERLTELFESVRVNSGLNELFYSSVSCVSPQGDVGPLGEKGDKVWAFP